MPELSAAALRAARFGAPGWGGDDEDEVDRHLESVEGALRARNGGGGTGMPNGCARA
jgi:hypothetical protein